MQCLLTYDADRVACEQRTLAGGQYWILKIIVINDHICVLSGPGLGNVEPLAWNITFPIPPSELFKAARQTCISLFRPRERGFKTGIDKYREVPPLNQLRTKEEYSVKKKNRICLCR